MLAHYHFIGVDALATELQAHGLPVYGNKKEKVSRLKSHYADVKHQPVRRQRTTMAQAVAGYSGALYLRLHHLPRRQLHLRHRLHRLRQLHLHLLHLQLRTM